MEVELKIRIRPLDNGRYNLRKKTIKLYKKKTYAKRNCTRRIEKKKKTHIIKKEKKEDISTRKKNT